MFARMMSFCLIALTGWFGSALVSRADDLPSLSPTIVRQMNVACAKEYRWAAKKSSPSIAFLLGGFPLSAPIWLISRHLGKEMIEGYGEVGKVLEQAVRGKPKNELLSLVQEVQSKRLDLSSQQIVSYLGEHAADFCQWPENNRSDYEKVLDQAIHSRGNIGISDTRAKGIASKLATVIPKSTTQPANPSAAESVPFASGRAF